MNLRLKIFLALLGVISSMASLGFLGLKNLTHSRRAEAELLEINNQRIFLQRAWTHLEQVLFEAINASEGTEIGDGEKFRSSVRNHLLALDDLRTSGLDREWEKEILALRSEVITLQKEYEKEFWKAKGETDPLPDHPITLETRIRRIRQLKQTINDLFDDRFLDMSLSTNRRLQWSYVWFFSALFVSLLLALGFGYFLHRTILGPVGELRAAADRIRTGDLEISLDTSGNDEFGEVSRAFVKMSHSLQEKFDEEKRLNEELDEANQRLAGEKRDFERLVEIGNATSSSRHLARVLATLTTQAAELIGCFRCSVFQLDPNGSGAATVLSSTLHLKGGPVKIELSKYPEIRAAAETRETIRIDDAGTDEMMADVATAVRKVGITSILSVPMLHKGRFLGVLSFLRDGHGKGKFNAWESRLAETIGGIGAICMENANLFASIQESRDRVEGLNATLSKTVEELRATRDRLIASEKMAAIGEVSASLAHSLRNPLAAIRSVAQASLGNGGSSDGHRDIMNLVDRMERHLNQILTFCRGGDEVRTEVDPNDTVRTVLEILKSRAGKSEVSLVPRLDPELPRLVANPERLERALLAVVENAIEASERGGTVEVRTRRDDGSGLRIEVEDHGPGISEEVLPRVFDPFFSTKSNGTGLGTTIAARVVESLSGTIRLSPSPKGGSILMMQFPGPAP